MEMQFVKVHAYHWHQYVCAFLRAPVHTAHDIVRQRWMPWRTMSDDIGRLKDTGRCRAMSCAVWSSLYAMARMLSPVRPSFCLSDGWIIEKRSKQGLWNFHNTVATSI